MAKKSASKAKQAEQSPVSDTAPGALPLFSGFSRVMSTDVSSAGAATALAASATASPAREPVIRVNTANLTELKNAVDDHLKLVLSSPEQAFKRSYVHDDVRLAIGWTAVGVAVATGYYSYVVDDFHRTKHWVAVGVVVCVSSAGLLV